MASSLAAAPRSQAQFNRFVAPKPPQVRVRSLRNSAASPISVRQAARVIAGIHTEVVTEAFADRILVLVTQVGKVGCLVQVTTSAPAHYVPSRGDRGEYDDGDGTSNTNAETQQNASSLQSSLSSLPAPLPSTTLSPLLGAAASGDGELYSLYAAQIAAIVRDQASVGVPAGVSSASADRPVVVGLALLPRRRTTGQEEGREEDEGALDEEERARFGAVMDMVKEARVW